MNTGTRVDPPGFTRGGWERDLRADREGTIPHYCTPPALSEEDSIENISPEVGQGSLPEGLSTLIWLSSPAPVLPLILPWGATVIP